MEIFEEEEEGKGAEEADNERKGYCALLHWLCCFRYLRVTPHVKLVWPHFTIRHGTKNTVYLEMFG